jgi:hypothetical protein
MSRPGECRSQWARSTVSSQCRAKGDRPVAVGRADRPAAQLAAKLAQGRPGVGDAAVDEAHARGG